MRASGAALLAVAVHGDAISFALQVTHAHINARWPHPPRRHCSASRVLPLPVIMAGTGYREPCGR